MTEQIAARTSDNLDDRIRRAASGDRSALESLLVHFHDPLLNHLRRAVSGAAADYTTPEDVLQETFVEVFRRIGALEPRGGDAFFNWLKTIARTRLINQIKARRALKRGGARQAVVRNAEGETITSILNLIAARQSTPSLILRKKEATQALAAALKALDPHRRQIMELRYGQGMSVAQVALKVGKSEGAVKMLINRTVSKLREHILVSGEITSFGT